MAVYQVTNKATGKKRLIETRNASKAVSFVAGSDYEAKALKSTDLWPLIQSEGLQVETVPDDKADDEDDKQGKLPGTSSDTVDAAKEKPADDKAVADTKAATEKASSHETGLKGRLGIGAKAAAK